MASGKDSANRPIVVGTGMGAGNGETVSLGSAPVPSASPAAEAAVQAPVSSADPAPADDASTTVGWFGGGAIGLALGAGVVLGLRRRRSA